MKTVKTEFDEVVYSTDPDLRGEYQRCEGMKHRLTFVLDEYRKLSASTPWSLYPWHMFGFFAVDLTIVVAVLAAFANSEMSKGHGLSHVVMIGIFLLTLAGAIMLLFYHAMDSKRRGEMTGHYQVLKKFAEAAGWQFGAKLTATKYVCRIPSDVKSHLVGIAKDLISEEKKFDGYLSLGRTGRFWIVQSGIRIDELDSELKTALGRARAFGEVCTRREIFALAKK